MIQYYNHPVAMPHMPLERNPGFQPSDGSPPIGPARFRDLYPHNALFWDTPLFHDAADVTPSMFWFGGQVFGDTAADTVSGFTLPAAFLDAGRLHHPGKPERRYRGPGRDRFATGNPNQRPDHPIRWPADEYLQEIGGFAPTYNTDFGGGTVYVFAVGAPRWRHNGNSMTNVVYSDGSVKTLKLNTKRRVNITDYDNEFFRYYLMIKWPSNKKDLGGT
jgi:prepilin-type processing-associated H-X9-DG protein